MKSVLIDASSAILLFKAELITRMADLYDLTLVPAVAKEITVSERPGAFFFRQMISEGRLGLRTLKAALPSDPAMTALGPGERETLLAFEQCGADFIIIDDRKGAQWCRSNRIPYINALLCSKILFIAGHLSPAAFIMRSGQLLEIGRYSRWVVDFVQRCDRNDLTVFLPERILPAL